MWFLMWYRCIIAEEYQLIAFALHSYNSYNSIIQDLLLNLLVANPILCIRLSILALLQEDMTDEAKIFRAVTDSFTHI